MPECLWDLTHHVIFFLPRINPSLLWRSGCFVLGTIHANQGLWGHSVVLVRMVLSCSGCSVYCLTWMFDMCSGASTACVPVLVAPVVSRPRATLWNKTKPLDHQLVLQKWIFFSDSTVILQNIGIYRPGRMALAELLRYSRLGLSVIPLSQVVFLIPKYATHKWHPWHLCVSSFFQLI